ncbi:RNA polymerase sigma factor [Evansella sp. AB-P1]|uniref:RNA polymerase sigma factor n=1 Tax=Evansella sp. AB-P1 TaxID=3037653 RepID=UPI00241EF555|nr:RNA polymerase sigma factor [Evansella sp. AB-P1]MDG5786401.1 RNA polymerase sigma factor [Evansella sp. AB-P1]
MPKDTKTIIDEAYEQYSDAIFKYICMMVRDYQQGQDLTHETFIKAYENYESFEGKAELKTWLFRIAHNVTIDYVRKKKPLRLIESFLNNKKDPSPLPEENLKIQEDVKVLYKGISNLKPAYKEVIILRKIKGFSINETSEILHWSENKVKVTLHRAMPLLKKELEKEGYEHETKQ